MYADCPSCQRQFVVRAQHLAAAAGEVRCGFCGTQFNALQRLHDAPLPQQSMQPAEQEPQFDVPIANADTQLSEPIEPPRRSYVPRSAVPPEWVREPDDEDSEPGRGIWFGVVLVLMLFAVLQAAWFNRDVLLLRFPQLTPVAENLCARLQCSVVRNRDLAAIKLVNRDVRLHPRFENFLLVNATMTNESAELQPFPRVQLALYNTNGGTLAYRAFAPVEYLDKSVDLRAGMVPHTPVHFVLEVTGPTDGAVSFEFGFL